MADTQYFYQCPEDESHQIQIEANQRPDDVQCAICGGGTETVSMDFIWSDEA